MFTLNINKEFNELKAGNTCKKCNKLFENPLILTTCNHVMCMTCVKELLHQLCPICEIPFTPTDIKTDTFTESVIKTIQNTDSLFKKFNINNYEIKNVPINALSKALNEPTASTSKESTQDNCTIIGDYTIKFVKCMKKNPKGETELHTACKLDKFAKVEELIKSNNVDLNVGDNASWAPIHEAVQSGNYNCAELLIKAGALVNIAGEQYTTPLHQAVQLKYSYIAELLLKNGAKTHLKDYNGKTPLDLCSSKDINTLLNTDYCCTNTLPLQLFYNKEIMFYVTKKVSQASLKLFKKEIKFASQQQFYTKNNVTTLIIGVDECIEESLDILIAILNGVMIIREPDISRYLSGNKPLQFNLIPLELKVIETSIINRLKCCPKLFDGINFHILGFKSMKIHGVVLTKDTLTNLIEIGSGKILKRAPSEATAEISFYPFHAQQTNTLKKCSNYIIFTKEPLLTYNMLELKSRSVEWVIQCIWNFKLNE